MSPTIEVRVPGGELAERLLIGAAMYADSEQLAEIMGLCVSDDFLDPDLGQVWNMIRQLVQTGKAVTVPTMIYSLTKTGLINRVDEVELTSLFNEAFLYTGMATMKAHAGLVAEQGRRKREMRKIQADVQARVANMNEGGSKDWWEKYGEPSTEGPEVSNGGSD